VQTCSRLHGFQNFSPRHELIRHTAPLFTTFNTGRAISFSRLWQVLESVLDESASECVAIIVDALDECEKRTRNLILNALHTYTAKDLGSTTSLSKIILTSRPLVLITDKIDPGSAMLWLWEKGRRNMITRDVGMVIKDQIQQLVIRTKTSEEPKAALEDKLAEQANGTLLWASG